MPQSLPDATITFPLLGNLTIDPAPYFKIGPLTIHWYGLIIAMGFLLAVLYCAKRAPEFGLTSDNVFDAILFGLPMALIGARIYFCIFHWDLFADDPVSVLYIWQGGLGFYGSIVGALLVVILYCRRKKLSILAFLDMLSFGFLIGQMVGRWGNFINREAFGYETDIFCRMVLTTPDGTSYSVHPTFLYESVWNLIGFTLMHFWSKKHRSFDGQAFLIYLAWYGFGRMFIEGLRTDSLYLFNTGIRVSQLVSFILFLASAAILLYNRFVRRPDPKNMFVNRKKAALAAEIVSAGGGAEEPGAAGASGATEETGANEETGGDADGASAGKEEKSDG